MKNVFLIFFFLFLTSLAFAEETQTLSDVEMEIKQTESTKTKDTLSTLSGNSQIPLEKYDTTAVVQIPVMSPSKEEPTPETGMQINQTAPKGSAGEQVQQTTLPPTQDNQNNAQRQDLAPEATPEEVSFLTLKMNKHEPDTSKIPDGTLAVYINVEEAFNENPWTIEARKTLRLELEAKQLEYAQLTEQISSLKERLKYLREQLVFYLPFYKNLEYVPPTEDRTYPRITPDFYEQMSKNILYSSSVEFLDSPQHTPQSEIYLREQIREVKKAIIEKETFLQNFKELSKEEVNSRQDYIVGQILKEIYSGIKEYSRLRSIGLVVDKSDLLYGNPLNVTEEFIKWMKKYHKKYKEELGDKK